MSHLYAGLDVSSANTSICVVDVNGSIVDECCVASTPAAIYAALKAYRARLCKVGHETGMASAWLHHSLVAKRLPMLCLDARQTRAALSAQRNKTDRNDARDIAKVLARGFNGVVHVKSAEAQRMRLLLTYRRALKRKARDLESTLRTTLKTFGIEAVRAGRDIKLSAPRTADKFALTLARNLFRARQKLLAEASELEAQIVQTVKSDPVCRRLMTVPGVGPITALTFKAGVDDPARFKTSRVVGAHFGLTPRRIQSGQTSYLGRISRDGDREVRSALYEAASSLLAVSKQPSNLKAWGVKLRERKGFKVAAVACARKLAIILHALWVTGVEYAPLHNARK